jgi:hypothetical protein
MTAGGTAAEETLFCYRHPDRETYVRCGRCDRPICSRCAMQGPVGMRCKVCGTPPRNPLHSLTAGQFAAGAAVAIGAGTIAGFIGLQLGFLLSICIGPFVGGLIGEATMRATGYKRGPLMLLLVGGGIVAGVFVAGAIQFFALPGMAEAAAFGGLGSYLTVTAFSATLYVAAAMFGAYLRLR